MNDGRPEDRNARRAEVAPTVNQRPGATLPDPGMAARAGADDPFVGVTLGERFLLQSLLGRGGFGRVYRGLHLALGAPVAVKLLLEELAGRREARVRFQREATTLARIRHPGIVTVHDFGEHEGSLYLVMELVAGRALADVVGAERPALGRERVGRIFGQLVEVIEAAHAAGVVHRDLKPENVMLVGDGAEERVKVLDFGLALLTDPAAGPRLTASQVVTGTPLYMSPEQSRGARDVGPPTDIYAFGVMLYEALAGVLPFDADSNAVAMIHHMYVDPPSIAERAPGREAAPELEALAMRALAKHPEARPSATEMRAGIAAALAGTDAVSRAARQAEARAHEGTLDREARGHALARPAATTTPARPRAIPDGEATWEAALWGLERARVEGLRTALAVHGVAAAPWTETAPPPFRDDTKGAAVVVAGDPRAVERVRALRAAATGQARPVLVIDVARPDDTAALIRAGASDVTLAATGDEVICKKLVRLLRRGR